MADVSTRKTLMVAFELDSAVTVDKLQEALNTVIGHAQPRSNFVRQLGYLQGVLINITVLPDEKR